MNKTKLFEPAAAPTTQAGGTILQNAGESVAGEFLKMLPEDIRGEASLKDFKDVGSLAKSYVETKRLVGADKMAKPQENWDDAKWNEFWGQVGRPEKPEGYDFKMPELPEGIEIDQESVKEAVGLFHAAGLTKRQAEKVAIPWISRQIKLAQEAATQQKVADDAAVAELQKDWGLAYPERAAAAKMAIRHYAEKEPKVKAAIEALLEDPKFGSNPAVLRLWATIGQELIEDGEIKAGGASGGLATTPEQAQSELDTLMKNPDWRAKYQIKGSAENQRANLLINIISKK